MNDNPRLRHDAAWDAALQLLRTVQHRLPEEELHKIASDFYQIVKAAILSYEVQNDRRLRRLYGCGDT